MEYGILTVRNEAQKILFDQELSGQISDGMWENARPNDHWQPWCNAEVVVGTNVGRNFYARKDNYNINSSELLSIVGDRMLESVQKVNPDYTEADMKADLIDLKRIMKIQRDETPGEVERRRMLQASDARAKQDAQDKRNRDAAEVKQLADELGIDVGYIGTTFVSYRDGLSFDKVLLIARELGWES